VTVQRYRSVSWALVPLHLPVAAPAAEEALEQVGRRGRARGAAHCGSWAVRRNSSSGDVPLSLGDERRVGVGRSVDPRLAAYPALTGDIVKVHQLVGVATADLGRVLSGVGGPTRPLGPWGLRRSEVLVL
jgi:hypothetical protein